MLFLEAHTVQWVQALLTAHRLEFISFCVLPWHIMEWHWHFPPAISHTCINKTMQTKALYPSSATSRPSRHYSLPFSKNTIWMLILELSAHFLVLACSVPCMSSRLMQRAWLCCLVFHLRQILQNVESYLLKWQWSIMTDVVIIGRWQRCLTSKFYRRTKKNAKSYSINSMFISSSFSLSN